MNNIIKLLSAILTLGIYYNANAVNINIINNLKNNNVPIILHNAKIKLDKSNWKELGTLYPTKNNIFQISETIKYEEVISTTLTKQNISPNTNLNNNLILGIFVAQLPNTQWILGTFTPNKDNSINISLNNDSINMVQNNNSIFGNIFSKLNNTYTSILITAPTNIDINKLSAYRATCISKNQADIISVKLTCYFGNRELGFVGTGKGDSTEFASVGVLWNLYSPKTLIDAGDMRAYGGSYFGISIITFGSIFTFNSYAIFLGGTPLASGYYVDGSFIPGWPLYPMPL